MRIQLYNPPKNPTPQGSLRRRLVSAVPPATGSTRIRGCLPKRKPRGDGDDRTRLAVFSKPMWFRCWRPTRQFARSVCSKNCCSAPPIWIQASGAPWSVASVTGGRAMETVKELDFENRGFGRSDNYFAV